MGYLATRAKVERRMVSTTKRKDFMRYVRGHGPWRAPPADRRKQILRHNNGSGMTKAEIVGSTTVLVNAGGEVATACMGAAESGYARDLDSVGPVALAVRHVALWRER